MSKNLIKNFLNKENIFAVVGASSDKGKYGYKVFKKLIDLDYKAYPVNPNADIILEEKVYDTLKDLPEKPDVVSIVTPPKVTEKIVKQCKKLGIEKVWMQSGAESKEAIKFCNQNDIDLINGQCIIIKAYQ